MPVAEAAASAAEQLHLLAVIVYLAEKFACLGIEHHSSARYLYYHIVAILAEAAASGAALSVAGKHMPVVLEREQCPHMAVTLEYDMSATTSVATVRAPFGHIFSAVEMS